MLKSKLFHYYGFSAQRKSIFAYTKMVQKNPDHECWCCIVHKDNLKSSPCELKESSVGCLEITLKKNFVKIWSSRASAKIYHWCRVSQPLWVCYMSSAHWAHVSVSNTAWLSGINFVPFHKVVFREKTWSSWSWRIYDNLRCRLSQPLSVRYMSACERVEPSSAAWKPSPRLQIGFWGFASPNHSLH